MKLIINQVRSIHVLSAMGKSDTLKAFDYFGGIATTQDIGKYVNNPHGISKDLCSLRRDGKIESIDSCFSIGRGARTKIWIKYD